MSHRYPNPLTITFTPEQVFDLLGALNTAVIARRNEAKRCKNVITKGARNSLSEKASDLFCEVVRARAAAHGETDNDSIEADGGVSTP